MIQCRECDLPRLFAFYRLVSEETENMKTLCRWIYGLHPSEKSITEYLNQGAMYLTEENGEIVAAVAAPLCQPESYHGDEWRKDLADDELATVHLLAVHPHRQKSGLAKTVMREVLALAEKNGMKAVRLDALASNTPAHKLYESLGFEKRGVRRWYAPNLGWDDFLLYEYLL